MFDSSLPAKELIRLAKIGEAVENMKDFSILQRLDHKRSGDRQWVLYEDCSSYNRDIEVGKGKDLLEVFKIDV